MKVFSDISLWWLLPCFTASVGFAYLYYRNQKQLNDAPKALKLVLTALRAFSILLLIVILFGILLESKDSKTEKPVFINIVDNSSSMLNYKDSLNVSPQIKEYFEQLKKSQNDRFDIVNYLVDDDVEIGDANFEGSVTNLNSSFEYIYNQYYNKNIGGICLISDGNYNEGQNPLFTAEKISLTPIFTLGVGDTLVKRDQVLKSVASNQVAFLGNQFPIEIDVEARQFENKKSRIQIIENGKVLSEQIIDYSSDVIDFQHFSIMMKAKKIGFNNYIVKVVGLDGEATLENNSRSIFVEVLDSRSKILMLSSAPHPDISAIKQVLETDDKLEVESTLLNDWDGSLKDYQMVVVHGLHGNRAKELADKIKGAKKPAFYIIDNKTSKSDLKSFEIDLNIPNSSGIDEVQGSLNKEFQLFECSEDLSLLLSKAPPLKVRFGKTVTGSGKVLISQRIGPVEKQDAILFFGKSTTAKYGVVVGEGLWKWKLSEYARTKNNKGYIELIQKPLQYLLVRSNIEPLRINFPQRFNFNESVKIAAEFYNESMSLITTPVISFKLTDDQKRAINYEFAVRNKGYDLNLGKLKPGKYNWMAETKYNGKNFQKSGEFVVEDMNIEAISTSSDFGILKQLSGKSNGRFHRLKDNKQLISDISARKDIVSVTYEESSYNELIDLIWLFILLVVALTTEWFLRRYYGTY